MGSGALYNRLASLIIAPTSGAMGVDVTGLRISFEVRKTSSSAANPSSIQVYNLSPSTRNKILAKKTALILRAGYGATNDQIPLLASGVILRVEHAPQPPDVVSTFEIRDGGLGLDEAKFRRAYGAGTSVKRIMLDILGQMSDVSQGPMVCFAIEQNLSHKRSFSGSARQAMDKLASAYGFEWSVQNGVFQALDRFGTTLPQISATVLSPETGMVGSPTKTNAGCKVTSLLMPHIIPGSFVQVKSEFCSGYFKALTVEHKGDTHDGDYQTVTEAKSIDKWVGPGAKKGKKK